jgi:hydroxymethylglutaryl-CoA synthase
MLDKRPGRNLDYFHEVDAVFMHRPYHQMPTTGWVMAYLFALAHDDQGQHQLRTLAGDAGVDAELLIGELLAPSPFRVLGSHLDEYTGDVFPLARRVRNHLRKTPLWHPLVHGKLGLGSEAMRDLGNLCTAALPAWLASGLRQALTDALNLADQEWLALGYGSGDSAAALRLRVVAGWEEAAARINFDRALLGAVDLNEVQYIDVHEGRLIEIAPPAHDEFVIDHVGTSNGPDFFDEGVDYYRYVSGTSG